MTETQDIITVDEAAEILRVNRKTVYDMVRDGELAGAQKLRGIIRIRKSVMLASFSVDAPPKQRKRAR